MDSNLGRKKTAISVVDNKKNGTAAGTKKTMQSSLLSSAKTRYDGVLVDLIYICNFKYSDL